MDAREQAADKAPGRPRDLHQRAAAGSRALRRLAPLALAGALALAGCGSEGADEDEARALLERSFAKEVRSADLTLDLEAQLNGIPLLLGKPLELSLSGPFESNGSTELPTLDWTVKASGAGRSLAAGVVATTKNAFVEYGGTSYEVGEDLIARLKRESLAQKDKNEDLTLADFGLKPEDWLGDAEVSSGEPIGGVATTRVSGKLDVGEFLRGLRDALESDAAKKQLGGRKLDAPSDQEIETAEDAVEDPRFELDVGKGDGILRRLHFDFDFDVPEDARADLSGLQGGSFRFDVRLDEVNQPVGVEPPTDARPISELLRQLGIPPELLLGAGAAVPTPQ